MTYIAPEPQDFLSPPFRIDRDAAPDSGRPAAEGLAREVAAEFGPRDEKPFALVARDHSGGWIGGINGVIHWRWLYVAQFFVAPDWRERGVGAALLRKAQDLARENRCVGIYLDTFSPRAKGFYEKSGFIVAGRIENFPPGASRSFLFKPLTPD